ncbi:MAG: response regulator transcription factor [Lachnospiraceae bacterium]|nr:response regulator transcription factor [Lachnospiraceae bacterium]
MRSLYIADDEKPIRDGIKLVVDWNALGYELCGEAGNGTDAVSDIEQLNPDLVLMDIRMPGKGGIDAIRELTENGFEGHFIILSGYSDFKYAQAAMKYNVRHYLTKPIDEDELVQAVNEINALLDSKADALSKEQFLKSRSKKEILQDILDRSIDLKHLSPEELGLAADRYRIVAYEDFNISGSEIKYRFSELFNAAGSRSGAAVHFTYKGHDLLLLLGTPGLSRFEKFLAHYESVPEKGSPLDSIFVAYGRIVDSLGDIPDSYEQAEQLLKRRFFCSQGQHVLGYDDLPSFDASAGKPEASYIERYTRELTDYLQTFNRRKTAEVLYSVEEYLYHADADISEVKLFLADLYLRIKDSMTHRYSPSALPFASNSEIIAFINSANYLYEIILYFSRCFELFMSSLGNFSRDSVIDDVLYYIDHNYNTNLKLETIASLFGYNSSYLGKVFTKTVGESFNTYVDRIRIDHAIKLLTEGKLKVYEISEKVGYNNVDYFHKKFKKYVGVSPVEYRSGKT